MRWALAPLGRNCSVSRSSAAGTKAVERALLCARQLGEIHAEGGGHDSSVTGSALKVRNNKNAQSSSLVRKRYDKGRPGSSGALRADKSGERISPAADPNLDLSRVGNAHAVTHRNHYPAQPGAGRELRLQGPVLGACGRLAF